MLQARAGDALVETALGAAGLDRALSSGLARWRRSVANITKQSQLMTTALRRYGFRLGIDWLKGTLSWGPAGCGIRAAF